MPPGLTTRSIVIATAEEAFAASGSARQKTTASVRNERVIMGPLAGRLRQEHPGDRALFVEYGARGGRDLFGRHRGNARRPGFDLLDAGAGGDRLAERAGAGLQAV